MNLQVLIMAVVSKTDISQKIPKSFKFVKKMNLNVRSFSSSQNIPHDLKGPKVKTALQCTFCDLFEEFQTYHNDPKFGQTGLGKQRRPGSDCSWSILIRVFTGCNLTLW